MAKSKLKVALDNQKGRNIKLEKQRKKEKEARKRKEKNKPAVDIEDVEDVEGNEEEGGIEIGEEDLQALIAATTRKDKKVKKDKYNGVKAPKDKKSKANVIAKKEVEEPEWETEDEEEEEDDDDDDDMPERPTLDLTKLEDSDSEGSSEDDIAEDDEDEDEEDEDEDIAFSDIESLASEDKADVIPHQRLTINNTSALLAGLKRIQLPYSKLAFSEYQSITSDEPTEIPDVEDDLTREKAFYQQALSAVNDARAKLKKEGTPFSRPADYFAEMVKSDEHMGKIKAKLIDEAAGKKAAAEARKQRDLKKFGKQVQVAKLQERAKEKRDTLERINLMKRKRQNADITNTHEEDLFDVALDDTDNPSSDRRKSSDGKSNSKRQKKDAKYGFGGKKRFAKSNDAFSTNDARGFSHKKMKAGGAGGASKRLGKSRRAKRN